MKLRTAFPTILAALAVLGATQPHASAAIIISQYYEGTSNNKFIELYNSGATAVDLGTDAYKVSLYSNAARENWKAGTASTPAATTVALTGSLAAGATLTIAHGSAALPAYAIPADVSNSGVANFNGDDSVVVWTGATYSFASVVDAFGSLAAGGFGDVSYVRNIDITTGTNADFDAADWTAFSLAAVANAAPGTNERLDFHAAIPEPASLVLAGMGLFAAIVVRRRG